MKKVLLTVAIMLIALSSVFASFSYELDLLSFEPIHKEYFADTSRPSMHMEYANVFDGGVPTFLHQHNKIYNFQGKLGKSNQFIKFNIGETVSFLRNTFNFDSFISPISFDFTFQAMYRVVLNGDLDQEIGYDGVFFYGGSMSLADMVSLRVGLHHYCSHIGDGTMDRIHSSDRDDIWILQKYVRMDTFAVGLSVQPFDWVRVYGEINMPIPGPLTSFRPDMFAPNWRNPNNANAPHNFPDSYKAMIANVGIEFTYPVFKKLGNTTIGYDLHMYEEGKIVYDNTFDSPGTSEVVTDYYYDEDRPWELEHTVVIAQGLTDMVSIEMKFHHGRFLLNNFFNQRATYVSVGARVNFDGKLNIVNTKDEYYGLRIQ